MKDNSENLKESGFDGQMKSVAKKGNFDFSNVKDRDILKLVETIFNKSYKWYDIGVIEYLELKFGITFNEDTSGVTDENS